jgi:thiamine biosynthesis lipoprotein
LLIARALAYGAESDGAFDITIGAVTRLWDFHEGVVPAPEQIAAALPHVDYRAVHVDEDACTVTLGDPEAALDLGGIAKGFIADAILDELEDAGVTSAFVNLGGNVKVLGAKPDGSPWRVGVRDPESDAESARSIARVTLEGGSVVTSGLYERQFEQDGRRYWHILDPKTGYPVQTDLVSSSVLTESSLDGDAFATWMFLLGSEAALLLAESIPGLEALFVTEGGATSMTQGAHFEAL